MKRGSRTCDCPFDSQTAVIAVRDQRNLKMSHGRHRRREQSSCDRPHLTAQNNSGHHHPRVPSYYVHLPKTERTIPLRLRMSGEQTVL